MSIAPKRGVNRAETKVSDSELIRQCLEGHEEAWSSLIQRYKNLIYSVPIKYGYSREDAADVFQAVCLVLLSELPRLRDPKALPGWLARIAYHKCYHWKNEQRRYLSYTQNQEEPIANDDEIPENMLAELEQAQLVRDAIRELNPRCQEIVQRLFFENPPHSYEDVASDLGLTVGSIGCVRRRCLEKLRTQLEKARKLE